MANKMPYATDERQSITFNAPSTGSFRIDAIAIYVAKLKVSGSEQADKLMRVLAMDDVNLGILGRNPAESKALLVYALEKAPKIGQNIELYVAYFAENQEEIEKLAKARSIKLHYFVLQ